jgi:hypothetical protein
LLYKTKPIFSFKEKPYWLFIIMLRSTTEQMPAHVNLSFGDFRKIKVKFSGGKKKVFFF